MKVLLALLLCAQARAAAIPDLELLRSIAAGLAVPVADLPAAPRAQAAPVLPKSAPFEGFGTLEKTAPRRRRPAAALKNRSLTLDPKLAPVGAKPWLWIQNDAIGRALPAAGRVWVKGELAERVLRVDEYSLFPQKTADLLSAKASNKVLSAEIIKVYPWCDHMPVIGNGERRQFLVIETSLTNKTDKPLTVVLARAWFSFEPKSEGAAVSGLTVRGDNGRGNGRTSVVIAPGASLKLELRGDNLYPEGSHGKTLYATLELAAGAEPLIIRGAGTVVVTH